MTSRDGDSVEATSGTKFGAWRRLLPQSRIGRVVSLIVLAVVCWFGFHVWQVYDGLNGVRSNSEAAKSAILAGRADDARTAANDAEADARKATTWTHSMTWRALSSVPWLGNSFESAQQISDVVHDMTTKVLIPAVDAGKALAPDKMVAPGGKVDLKPLRESAPALEELAVSAREVSDAASQLPRSSSLWFVDNARQQLANRTDDLAKLLANSAIGARIAPAMLGEDGPRSYFIGFQTNAEARGTGGLVGGYGIIRAADGVVRVDKLAKNTTIPFHGLQPIDLGPDFAAQWGGRFSPTTDLRNSNFSPNFPFAARIWQSIWQQQSGETVDGAIATDPVALSYVLYAVGPVQLPDGEEIRYDNVVQLTMSTSYLRFGADTEGRKQYLQDVASAVVAKMTDKIESPRLLLEALGRAASEGRIAVWSADPAIEAELAATELGHAVPGDAAPYAAVVINNQGGNKLDYYLSRDITYSAGPCDGSTRDSTVVVRLTNNAPEEVRTYPEYVAGTVDRRAGAKGTNFPVTTLYATKGAKLKQITIDGQAAALPVIGQELGRPIFTAPTVIPIGKTVEIRYELTEPVVAGVARVPIQPLVDQPKVDVDVPVCAG